MNKGGQCKGRSPMQSIHKLPASLKCDTLLCNIFMQQSPNDFSFVIRFQSVVCGKFFPQIIFFDEVTIYG